MAGMAVSKHIRLLTVTRKPHTCFDVCCGAGVLSLGFKRAGFKVLGGIDVDRYAVESADYNMPDGLWAQCSIEQFSGAIVRNGQKPVRKANVILAGLPCQGFSVAGKCESDDERNILYKYLLKIVRRVRPDFVVVENVTGLLTRRNESLFCDLLKGFKRLGYDVDYRIYDALNFGVPQRRKRVVVVASRHVPVRFIFAGVRFCYQLRTVEDGLRGLDAKREDSSINHTFMTHSPGVIRKIKGIRNGGPISYRRLQFKQPSLTIISGHNALPLHPKEHRAISNREAARLQGIPDTFILKGSRTAQTLLVANAVPFPFALRIAIAIKNSAKFARAWRGALYEKLQSSCDATLKRLLRKGFRDYYRKKGRDYPWRKVKKPYTILLTELLLQRTKSDMVRGVWDKVVSACKPSDNGIKLDSRVLAGVTRRIGIHNRLVTIKKLNAVLVQHYNRKIPKNYEELVSLPGVGIYMAAAVRTFAFGIPDFPVDMNCFRFVNRFFGIKTYGRKSEARQIREFMNTVIPKSSAREFVYGFLDFCAAICAPGVPKCDCCFLKRKCKYNSSHRSTF